MANRRLSSLVVSLDKPAKPLAKPAVIDTNKAAAAAAAAAAACRPLGAALLARLLARRERGAAVRKYRARELAASHRHALALKATRV